MRTICLAALLALLAVFNVSAASPVYKVKGDLADAEGAPMTGLYLLDFKLREGGPDGPEVWSESQYVRAEAGSYTASLGKIRAIPEDTQGAAFLSADPPKGLDWMVGYIVLESIEMPESARLPRKKAAPPVPAVKKTPPPAPPKPPVPVAPPPVVKKTPPPAPKPVVRAAPPKPPKPSPPVVRAKKPKKIQPLKLRPKKPAVPMEVRRTSVRPQIYRTRTGDNLPSIAETIYGERDRWRDIYDANKSILGRGGAVKPGLVLVIP